MLFSSEARVSMNSAIRDIRADISTNVFDNSKKPPFNENATPISEMHKKRESEITNLEESALTAEE